VALIGPGDDDRRELLDLASDIAMLWEDEDLDPNDIRPLVTAHAATDQRRGIRPFLKTVLRADAPECRTRGEGRPAGGRRRQAAPTR